MSIFSIHSKHTYVQMLCSDTTIVSHSTCVNVNGFPVFNYGWLCSVLNNVDSVTVEEMN